MTNAELKAVLWREEYDFLHTNKHLGSNILFLTLSGSHAYGTNVEGSDIDIRGVAGSPEILGFNRFEQAIDNRTDTVIYAVNKFVGLLAQGNPNIIELLGNDPELYVNMTPEGQMLLDNRELFLTRRIAYSYGGFANDQLRRLQMGLLRNRVSPEALKNKFEKRSLERAIAGWGKDNIFEITISEDADEEGKHPLLISGSLNDYPVTSLKSLLKSLTTTIDQYEQPQHPKAQKDAAHINKHAMHIVRLYYTAFDILEKGEIITHRDKEREELLAIRNGKYLREDEIQLYRVRDIAFKQNFYERLCRVGSIHLCSTDAMTPEIDIRRIKNPRDVKEVLSKTIEACRKANGIRTSEIIGDHGHFPEPDPHGMPPEPCHEHPHD